MTARKPFDPIVLFERTKVPPRLGPWPTEQAQIDAVAAGEKPMSAFFPGRDALETTELLEYLELAFERGLCVVLDPERPHRRKARDQPLTLFVVRREEMWRIPAWAALHEVVFADRAAWTDAAERQSSLLLGYPQAERDEWMKFRNWRELRGTTIFALLDTDQRARVDELGQRTFGPPSSIEDIGFFLHRNGHLLKRTAARLVPRGFTLARVGIEYELARELFGFGKRRTGKPHAIDHTKMTPSRARRFNHALRTPIELLTAKGWK